MINKAILMGRFCADPELKKTQAGESVTSFRLAVENYGDKVSYIDCVAWKQKAEFITRYFHKGSLIAVEGQLQTRNYTLKNGENRSVTEVVIDRASFTGERNEHN